MKHNGTADIRIEYYSVDANKEYNYTMPVQTMCQPANQATKQESE